MQEPSIRTSRLAIAAGLTVAIILGGAGFVIGRTTAPQPKPPTPVVTAVPAAAPAPTGDGVLRRADLLNLAARAADAVASGEDLPNTDFASAGQRFELVLPFGCSGPTEDGSMRWRYDEAGETLRIAVEPTSWEPAQWGLDGSSGYEVAEGFWVGRPWSSSEECPRDGSASAPDTEAIALPGETLAIAQFFAEGDDRNALRNGRPYELVKRVPADAFDGSRGFLVRIAGRIANPQGVGPVRCVQPGGAQQRPVCAIGVRMDEVAIENPATGAVIGSWRLDTTG